jgi:hypothetical protein
LRKKTETTTRVVSRDFDRVPKFYSAMSDMGRKVRYDLSKVERYLVSGNPRLNIYDITNDGAKFS